MKQSDVQGWQSLGGQPYAMQYESGKRSKWKRGRLMDWFGNKCAICGRLGKNVTLVLDHNHDTDAVRGLLCVACNSGIGQLRDDVTLLQRAIEYIREDGPLGKSVAEK